MLERHGNCSLPCVTLSEIYHLPDDVEVSRLLSCYMQVLFPITQGRRIGGESLSQWLLRTSTSLYLRAQCAGGTL